MRLYGTAPYRIAVLHGGPGAPGYMAPVAQELSSLIGVIEPLQSAHSIDGQVNELHTCLTAHNHKPLTLIGSSWGAMLGFIYAARHPARVAKLIMIGSGVYEERYQFSVSSTRMARLDDAGRRRAADLTARLSDPAETGKDAILAEFGALLFTADTFDPDCDYIGALAHQYEVNRAVWDEARALRRSGALLEMGRAVVCPVVALHGDHDPHPADGVRLPLARVLRDFRFVPIEKCGHYPWVERQARDHFFKLLKDELAPVLTPAHPDA